MKKLLTPLTAFLIAVFLLSSFGFALAANPTKAPNAKPSVSSSQNSTCKVCKCVPGQACKCKAPCKYTCKASKYAPAAKMCTCKTCKCVPGKACLCKSCKCTPGKACVCKCAPGAVKVPKKNCAMKCDPKACSPKNCPTRNCK